MATTKSYKTCFVPLCANTTKSAPEKVFLHVPQDVKRRNRWFDAARRVNPKSLASYYCCEDHFDLAEDMENYVYYTMMGGAAKIKATAVPHKFECQPDRKRRNSMAERPASAKRRRRKEIDEILQQEAQHSTLIDELGATQIPTADTIPEQSTIEDCTTDTNKSTLTLSEPKDAKVTASTQTSIKQHSVAVQVNIRPKYRSVHSMCKIQTSIDKCCSPVKYPVAVEAAASAKNLASQKQSLAPKCISSSTTISSKDPSGSNDLYIPTDDSPHSSPNKNGSLVKGAATILNVTNYLISMNPKAYLGIPTEWSSLIDLLSARTGISADKIKLCLMKIRRQDTFERLGEQFCMTSSNASIIFSKVIPVLKHMLETLIFFPDKNIVKKMLPIAFRSSYSHVQSIVDAFEIEIEKPSDPVNQALTWSEYKKCNTLKYLISCTPDGFINFISTGYGGRISDVLLFEKCGILDKLPENCAVMADRGFKNIQSLLTTKKCVLIKPPSVLSTVKPTRSEVLETKRIASLRIHVERVIGRMREFDFLKPHAVMNHSMLSYTDDIVVIVSGLINLQTPIIRK